MNRKYIDANSCKVHIICNKILIHGCTTILSTSFLLSYPVKDTWEKVMKKISINIVNSKMFLLRISNDVLEVEILF